jgi:hypothetical protein
MSPQIQAWVRDVARKHIIKPGHVLEVGALDVNGTVRQFFADAESYIGTDMEAGPNVDLVLDNSRLISQFIGKRFDTIIACSVLEHDVKFWQTVFYMRTLLAHDGYLLITTPTFHFPLHRFPRDYWRFGEDAFREVFFDGMNILALNHVDNPAGKRLCIAGVAQKLESDY